MELLLHPAVVAAAVFALATVILHSINGFQFGAFAGTVWVLVTAGWAIWIGMYPPPGEVTTLFSLLRHQEAWDAMRGNDWWFFIERYPDRALYARLLIIALSLMWLLLIVCNIVFRQPYYGVVQVGRTIRTFDSRQYPLAVMEFGFWRHYVDLAACLTGILAVALAPG